MYCLLMDKLALGDDLQESGLINLDNFDRVVSKKLGDVDRISTITDRLRLEDLMFKYKVLKEED